MSDSEHTFKAIGTQVTVTTKGGQTVFGTVTEVDEKHRSFVITDPYGIRNGFQADSVTIELGNKMK